MPKDVALRRAKAKALMHSISQRIRFGLERNRRDYRLYKSMDLAYDIAKRKPVVTE